MSDAVLTFYPNNVLSEFSQDARGVVIIIGSEASSIGANKLWLHGAYQIDPEYAKKININTTLHNALIINSTSDWSVNTKNLIGNVVVFSDDEKLIDGVRTGYFNYDLTDWLYLYEKQSYYISVSLGKYISNTLKIEVNPVAMNE